MLGHEPVGRVRLKEAESSLSDIRLFQAGRGDRIVRETCPDGQFYFVYDGLWNFRSEGKCHLVGAFDVAYSAPQQPCVRTVDQPILTFGIQVRREAIERSCNPSIWARPTQNLSWPIKRHLVRMMSRFIQGQLLADEIDDLVLGLLDADTVLPTFKAEDTWIRHAIEILREGRPESQTLIELAQAIGISASHLSDTFRKQVGVTITTYRRQVRLDQALGMIGRGASLNEAALAVGFYDVSHLHRACLQEFGSRPTALLAQLKLKISESMYKTSPPLSA